MINYFDLISFERVRVASFDNDFDSIRFDSIQFNSIFTFGVTERVDIGSALEMNFLFLYFFFFGSMATQRGGGNKKKRKICRLSIYK